MNKIFRIVLFGAALMFSCLSLKADEDNYNQWASMEYKQWKFTPKSYYYSVWYKRVLGIKIPVFGLGVHDNGPANSGVGGDHYVDEKWRQMSPLRSKSVAAAGVELLQAKSIKNQWDSIKAIDMKEMADKSINLAIEIGKGARNKSISDICTFAGELLEGESNHVMEEYDMIKEKMNIIGGSFLNNSDKAIAYRSTDKNLERLSRTAAGIFIIQQLEKKYMPRKRNNSLNGGSLPEHIWEDKNDFNDKF